MEKFIRKIIQTPSFLNFAIYQRSLNNCVHLIAKFWYKKVIIIFENLNLLFLLRKRLKKNKLSFMYFLDLNIIFGNTYEYWSSHFESQFKQRLIAHRVIQMIQFHKNLNFVKKKDESDPSFNCFEVLKWFWSISGLFYKSDKLF